MAFLPSHSGRLVIVGLQGPNSPDESAAAVIDVLKDELSDSRLIELGAAESYDRSLHPPFVIRPTGEPLVVYPRIIGVEGSIERSSSSVTTLLITGPTPLDMWEELTEDLVELLDPERDIVVFLASEPDAVPHTRTLRVRLTSEDPDTVSCPGVQPQEREGTANLQDVIAVSMFSAGIPALTLTCAIPDYAALSPSPKAALALLSAIEDATGLTFDPGDLTEAARAWSDGVDMIAEADAELAKRIAMMEEEYDFADSHDGEDIAREFEKLLRRREEDR